MNVRELFRPAGTWETESSAAAMLVVGTWFVLDGFTSDSWHWVTSPGTTGDRAPRTGLIGPALALRLPRTGGFY